MVLAEQITLQRELAEAICLRLCAEINALGFAATECLLYPCYDEALFELVKDPFTGTHNLLGYWYDSLKKQRIGCLNFNSDGSFYAEFDVLKAHPTKCSWCVESVTAWGQAGNIKAEAKLLPLPQ